MARCENDAAPWIYPGIPISSDVANTIVDANAEAVLTVATSVLVKGAPVISEDNQTASVDIAGASPTRPTILDHLNHRRRALPPAVVRRAGRSRGWNYPGRLGVQKGRFRANGLKHPFAAARRLQRGPSVARDRRAPGGDPGADRGAGRRSFHGLTGFHKLFRALSRPIRQNKRNAPLATASTTSLRVSLRLCFSVCSECRSNSPSCENCRWSDAIASTSVSVLPPRSRQR